ncbi:uncharacterized protein [Palaemon carinicauda]|uniref:uncharacterized protein n=1 Tax=Palaemon carinicauda TaxID=392227 RepID=UPI0035B5B351
MGNMHSKIGVNNSALGTESLTTVSSNINMDIPHAPSNQTFLNPCDVTCNAPYVKEADPTDCHYYYLCKIAKNLTLHPIRIKCPMRRPVFVLETRKCKSNAICKVKCPLNNISMTTTEAHPETSPSSSVSSSSSLSISTSSSISTTFPTISSANTTPNPPPISTGFYTVHEEELITKNESYQTLPSTFSHPNYEIVLSTNDNPSECSPTCLVPDSWLPDPTDCHYFYVCHFLNDIISKPRRIACPANRPVFSRDEGRCQAKAPCVVTCQKPVTISPTAPTDIMNTDCNPKCLIPYSSVPDPSDCTRYYICIFLNDLTLEPVRGKCPRTKPFFDPVSMECSKFVNCNTRCTKPTVFPASSTESFTFSTTDTEDNCLPICKKPDTLVYDPTDCHAYHICTLTETGSLTPIKMKCPKDKSVFDNMVGSCIADTKCNTVCSNTSNSTVDVLTENSLDAVQDDNHTTTLSHLNGIDEISEMENVTDTTPQTFTDDLVPLSNEDCMPVCESHNTITHDPRDCHAYYVCMITQGKKYVTKVKCPLERPVFHLNTKSCQTNVPCIKICNKTIASQLNYTDLSHNISTDSSDITNLTSQDLMTTILHSPTGIEETLALPALLSTTVQPLEDITSNEDFSYYTDIPSEFTDYTEDSESVSTLSEIYSDEITPKLMSTSSLSGVTANPHKTTLSSSSVTAFTMVTSSQEINTSSSSSTTLPSPIKCFPECKKQGTLLPDLTDCHYYYVCIHLSGLIPQPVRSKCPFHSPIFDVDEKQCVAKGTCYNPCSNLAPVQEESLKETTAVVSTTATPDPCLVSCKILNTVIPDPRNCHFYYYCTLSEGILSPVRMECPAGRPIFNANYSTCSNHIPCVTSCGKPQSHASTPPSQIVSIISSIAYCHHAGYFASSERCISSYDYCYHQGDKLIKTRKQCPEGLVFNPISTYPYCVPPHDCPYDPQKYGPTANATHCRHPGRFPKCKDCCPEFIQCQPATGKTYKPLILQCSGGLVFNTDPIYPVCLRATDCPTGGKTVKQCEVQGNYPSCLLGNCCREYNHCTHDGRLQKRTCPYPFVFNNHPSYPYCILAWNCPYISSL